MKAHLKFSGGPRKTTHEWPPNSGGLEPFSCYPTMLLPSLPALGYPSSGLPQALDTLILTLCIAFTPPTALSEHLQSHVRPVLPASPTLPCLPTQTPEVQSPGP